MLVPQLRQEVLEANLELIRRSLVIYTFGNASGIARQDGLVVIKPSGVDFDKLTPESMVVTDLDGKIVEGTLRPSSDLDTHLVLYRAFSASEASFTRIRATPQRGPGGSGDPLLRHHARGLLSWPSPGDGRAQRRRDRR